MFRVNAAGKFQLFITFLPQYNAYIQKNRRKTNFGQKNAPHICCFVKCALC